MKKSILHLIMILVLISTAYSISWTPPGNMNGRSIYSILNMLDINLSRNLCIDGSCISAWSDVNLTSGGGGGGNSTEEIVNAISDQSINFTNRIVFNNETDFNSFIDLVEVSTPITPSVDHARIYAFDQNGKTVLYFVNGDDIARRISDGTTIVRNVQGDTISKGEIVHIVGATGDVPEVERAQANDTTLVPAIGMAIEDISDNGYGFVGFNYKLEGMDTSAYSEGQKLYLSCTEAGNYTATKPGHPCLGQFVGLVTKVNPSTGIIEIEISRNVDHDETGTIEDRYEIGSESSTNKSLRFHFGAIHGDLISTLPSSSRQWFFPDATGTIALLSNLIPDTNESTRFDALAGTDCAGTDKVIGVNASGGLLCGSDQSGSGGDGFWSIIDDYLYNNSGSLDVNETRLNATIDARDEVLAESQVVAYINDTTGTFTIDVDGMGNITGGGSANTIAKFTAGGVVGETNISDNGKTILLKGNTTIQGLISNVRFPKDGNAIQFTRAGINYISATDPSGGLYFKTGNANRLAITSDGRFGMYTTTPDTIFELNDGNGANGKALMSFQDNRSLIGYDGALGTMIKSGSGKEVNVFTDDNTHAMNINQNGKVELFGANNSVSTNGTTQLVIKNQRLGKYTGNSRARSILTWQSGTYTPLEIQTHLQGTQNHPNHVSFYSDLVSGGDNDKAFEWNWGDGNVTGDLRLIKLGIIEFPENVTNYAQTELLRDVGIESLAEVFVIDTDTNIDGTGDLFKVTGNNMTETFFVANSTGMSVGTETINGPMTLLRDVSNGEVLRIARNTNNYITWDAPGGTGVVSQLKAWSSGTGVTALKVSTGSSLRGDVTIGGFYSDKSADRIGIGTETPNEKLAVVGNINVTGTVNMQNISLINQTDGTSLYDEYWNGTCVVKAFSWGAKDVWCP